MVQSLIGRRKIARNAKQERSERTRSELLDYALRLFSLRGFEAVSVRDIAELAGVSHGLLRYYFGDKDKLWRESAEHLFVRMYDEVIRPITEARLAPRAKMEAFIRRYVIYCAQHPEHARLMVQESNRGSERLQWVSETFIRSGHDAITPLLDLLIASGDIAPIEPPLFIYMFTSMAQAPYLLTAEMKYTHGIDAMDDQRIAQHVDAVIALMLRPPPPGRQKPGAASS